MLLCNVYSSSTRLLWYVIHVMHAITPYRKQLLRLPTLPLDEPEAPSPPALDDARCSDQVENSQAECRNSQIDPDDSCQTTASTLNPLENAAQQSC